jgi:hypothetical protein
MEAYFDCGFDSDNLSSEYEVEKAPIPKKVPVLKFKMNQHQTEDKELWRAVAAAVAQRRAEKTSLQDNAADYAAKCANRIVEHYRESCGRNRKTGYGESSNS